MASDDSIFVCGKYKSGFGPGFIRIFFALLSLLLRIYTNNVRRKYEQSTNKHRRRYKEKTVKQVFGGEMKLYAIP